MSSSAVNSSSQCVAIMSTDLYWHVVNWPLKQIMAVYKLGDLLNRTFLLIDPDYDDNAAVERIGYITAFVGGSDNDFK